MKPLVSKNVNVSLIEKRILSLDAHREDSDVTPMKLQKMLYFSQANYIASTGYRLFDETTYAFEHGPVYKPLYEKHRGVQQILVVEHPEAAENSASTLPADISEFLDQVWQVYGLYSAAELRRISHDGHKGESPEAVTPWRKNFIGGFYDQIPDSDIAPYFRSVVPLQYRVFHPDVAVLESSFIDSLDEYDETEVQRIRALLHG